MRAGPLRHQLTFMQPSSTRDAYGESIQAWNPVVTVWGSITQLRGGLLELAQARTSTATATHQINIRYNPQVNEKMRIQYGLTPEDLDTLEVSDLETLTLGELNALAYDDAGAEPATYTINSILDPDTRRRWLNILVTMVRA